MSQSGKKNSNYRRTGNNKGTTMLETMVAFVVLMVIIGILYGIIAFCSELRMSAADTNRAMETFSKEIYKSAPNPDIIKVTDCKSTNKPATAENSYMSFFYLELSIDETDSSNLPNTEPTKEIALKDLQAKTYLYKENGFNGVTPKAIEFIHKNDWSENNNTGN